MLRKCVSTILCVALLFTSVEIGGVTMPIQKAKAAVTITDYEIYPVPQKTVYSTGEFTISDNVNVVFEEGIDVATKNRLIETLTMKGITVSTETIPVNASIVTGSSIVSGPSIVPDTSMTATESVSSITNILVGINGASGVVDDYFTTNNISEDSSFFGKNDAYILSVKDGTIAILGKNTDAAFYGITTLKMILKQMGDKVIRNLRISDFATSPSRGFIEGYYGIPWSNENRMSLMKFGSDFKMNEYVFAPKDDPYHNSKWREAYPQAELEKIRQMAAVGNASKCRFVWTIHTFMSSPIRFNTESNYVADLKVITDKFESLYGVGVRQFGLLADDAGGTTAANMSRLLNDLNQWVKSKGDVYNLVYCPHQYNESYVGDGYAFLKAINKTVANDVDIFWTGRSVCGYVTQSTVDNFKNGLTTTEKAGRNPLIWLNWPVNDINKARLIMGPGEVLNQGVTNLSGVITNPMQQAQASKTALFAVADYGWNGTAFNANKSWADSFKYIDEDAAEELHTIAKHLIDPAPNGHGLNLNESVELGPKLTEFNTIYKSGQSIEQIGTELIAEYNTIIKATEDFQIKSKNEGLKEEINPWRLSLMELSKATVGYIETAIAYEKKDYELVWAKYSEAAAHFSTSKNFEVKNIDGMQKVEAGYEKLIPFAKELASNLAVKVDSVVNPNAGDTNTNAPINASIIKCTNFLSIYQGAEANILDNDLASYAWYKTANDRMVIGDYIGVDLGKVIRLGEIHILQGKDDSHGDYITQGDLEYSVDGTNYTLIKSYTNAMNIQIDVTSQDINARYVRFRATADIAKWCAIRNISVTSGTLAPELVCYTNVSTLSDRRVTTTQGRAELTTNTQEITLAKDQYVGVMLPRIRDLSRILAEYTQSDKLTLESSVNAVEWKLVTDKNVPEDARYIRIINKGTAAVTFTLGSLVITSNEIQPISYLESNFSTIEGAGNAFDGDRTTKAWFKNSQASGKYIIYDLGQTIPITDLKMVLHDGENDYIRNGEISVSTDKTNWTKVLRIGDGRTEVAITDVYQVHEISYNTIANKEPINKDAKYIKIELTSGPGSVDKWVRFSEIELNQGAYIPTENNPTYVSTPIERVGHEPKNLVDGNVDSTYMASENLAKKGSLVYQLSKDTNVTEITILQNPRTISNAKVSIRFGEDQWETIGQLNKSLNVYSNFSHNNIFEVKLEWEGITPELHEMYFSTKEIAVEIPKQYNVVFAGGEGATGTAPILSQQIEGAKITLPSNPFMKEGYEFIGWSDGIKVYAENAEYTMATKDVTFSASWKVIEIPVEPPVEPEQYTVVFVGGEGATGVAPILPQQIEGAKVTLPSNSFMKAGYEFAGWSDGLKVYKEKSNYTMPKNQVTFRATWSMIITPPVNSGTVTEPVVVPLPKIEKPEETIVSKLDIVSMPKIYSNTTTTVKITWETVSGASGYEVFRAAGNKKTFVKVGTTTSTSFKDTKLSEGQNYTYKLRAYVGEGKEVVYGSDFVINTATAPKKPILTAKKITLNEVKLTWSKDAKVDGYEIYMSTDGKTYKKIADKTGKIYAYTKSKLKKDKTYVFKIKGYKKIANKKIYSSYSTIKKVKN